MALSGTYTVPLMYHSQQLMVVTWKAKSENEETLDCVRAKTAVTTELVEGIHELWQQITHLMATLTQVGWSDGNTSTPSSLQDCGCGQSAWNSSSWLNSQSRRGGPTCLAQPHSLLGEEAGSHNSEWGKESTDGNWEPSVRRDGAANHSHSSATDARDGATWSKSALHRYLLSATWGELRECG